MTSTDDRGTTTLADRLADPSRPVFLLGEVPPQLGTSPAKCLEICTKFSNRSRVLATDGFIVYDIQDEPGRSDQPRPFPFRKLMDSSPYAALLARTSGKEALVYKCVADASFDDWLKACNEDHGHSAINLVGRATSKDDDKYQGPTIAEAMAKVSKLRSDADGAAGGGSTNTALRFGCVCIAERHTLEAAKSRGKDYPTEHLNMMRKQKAGADWFVSQAVYDVEPTIRLLKDYASLCRQLGEQTRKVVLTFAPVSRPKTMNFIKWLGVKVPSDVEESILQAERPADKSIEVLCDHLTKILQECSGLGVPLGISCESVSIFKVEIDAVHELFRRLQRILLDTRGSPWKVVWVDTTTSSVLSRPYTQSYSIRTDNVKNKDEEDNNLKSVLANKDNLSAVVWTMMGVCLGGALVSTGVLLGGGGRRSGR
jgi:Methylenetetrahydrofolate reductase